MYMMVDTRKQVEYFDSKIEFSTGPIELKSLIDKKEDINIVDVRQQEDYKKGHIPGAINLPKDRWDTLEGLNKDKTNIVYCYDQQCHLAANACKHFAENGYPVMELEGGFGAWRDHSLPVEK